MPRLTSWSSWATMPAVRRRKTLAAALLLLASAMGPGLAWTGAHVHHHGQEAESARELAEILVHGHEHQEGTPEHEHSVRPAPPVRQDAPASAPASEVALLESAADAVSGTPSGWQPPRLAGPGPPLLHLLCTLLI